MNARLDDGAELFYTIDDFSAPWTQPETVVLHHGMAKTIVIGLLGIQVLASGRPTAVAQAPGDKMLRIGTKSAPPFVIKRADGTWDGISIALWQRIATELGLRYEFVERDLQGLLAGVADGSLDAAVAAVTITADRDVLMDFTYAYHVAGLGIGVAARGENHWY